MAIALTNLGNAINGTSISTLSFTMTHGIAAGDLSVIGFVTSQNAGSPVVSSIGDGTNTYSLVVSKTFATNNSTAFIYASQNSAVVASGGTIQATLTAAANFGLGIAAATISGIVTSGAVDVTNSSNTSGTNPSVASGVLAQPIEIVIGVADTGQVCTLGGSGFTDIFNGTANAANVNMDMAYQITNSTPSVTYQVTQLSSANALVLASFKGISTPVLYNRRRTLFHRM